MNEAFNTLGIAGSLRQHSFNRAALRAAQRLVLAGVAVISLALVRELLDNLVRLGRLLKK